MKGKDVQVWSGDGVRTRRWSRTRLLVLWYRYENIWDTGVLQGLANLSKQVNHTAIESGLYITGAIMERLMRPTYRGRRVAPRLEHTTQLMMLARHLKLP